MAAGHAADDQRSGKLVAEEGDAKINSVEIELRQSIVDESNVVPACRDVGLRAALKCKLKMIRLPTAYPFSGFRRLDGGTRTRPAAC
jgi:hypothetical protein